MHRIELLPEDFCLDGRRVYFVRQDGTPTENAVGTYGEDKDGNIMFFEIVSDKIARPMLDGKEKYCRILIQRVHPCFKLPAKEQG